MFFPPGFEALYPFGGASNPGGKNISGLAEADRLEAGGLYPTNGK